MKIFNKIENIDLKKLFLISLISCICFAVSKIALLILHFNFNSLFLLLIYLTLNILIVVFIKKENLNNAFLMFIYSSLADILFNFMGLLSSVRLLVYFILTLALLTVLVFYFIKDFKDLKLAYIIIAIFACFSIYGIVENFYWLFKFDKGFYYNIIKIVLNFSTLLYYFIMIAIVSKPHKENNIELIIASAKIVGVIVAVAFCIAIIKSCSTASDSDKRCKYIDEYGNSCYKIATKGDLCKEHFNKTMDFYYDLENWWNNLK